MKLHIPEQIKSTKTDFAHEPEQFKQWLADLPQTNMGELTRNVFNALCEHNRHIMPDDERFEILEMLRERLREIVDNLNKHFSNRTLPLPEKSQKIVNLNQSLLREVALGYKILINNIANTTTDNIDMVSTAICRAIRYQSELLLCASEVYAQSPAGTWLDLHTIFDYAERIGVTKKQIDDTESESGSATIEDYYKQVLLFALARPSSLRQRDTEQLYHELSDWAKLTEISDTPDKDETERIFCVRIKEDRPPTYLKDEDCKNSYPVRTLDASALSKAIHNKLNGFNTDSTSPVIESELSPEALQILTSSWGIFAERSSTRSARIGHISTAIGMICVTTAIKNEDAIRKASDSLYDEHTQASREQLNASFEALDDSAQSENSDDKKNKKADAATPESIFNDQRAMAINDNLQIGQEDIDSHWEIVNVSAGGYCLRWKSDETSKAQIGELIALRERDVNGSFQWRAGVIRWMQYTREHGLEIGVQLLATSAYNATIRSKSGTDQASENCIILPEIDASQFPTAILLPTHTFETDDCLELNTLDQTLEIKLISIKEKTGSFTQYVFNKTEAPIKLYNTSRENSHENTDDFAEIWPSL